MYAPDVEAHGHEATLLLDETGFPHATRQSVEEYQLIDGSTVSRIACARGQALRCEPDHVTIRIDWANHEASLVNESVGHADVVVVLPPGTYHELEARLASIAVGHAPAPASSYLRLWNDIVFRSTVSIHGESRAHVLLWKMQLTRWASRAVKLYQNGGVHALSNATSV